MFVKHFSHYNNHTAVVTVRLRRKKATK